MLTYVKVFFIVLATTLACVMLKSISPVLFKVVISTLILGWVINKFKKISRYV